MQAAPAPPPALAPEGYLDSSSRTLLVWVVAGVGFAGAIVILLLAVALVRGRRDKQVKAVGFGFIVSVLLGALCGQAFVILQVCSSTRSNGLGCTRTPTSPSPRQVRHVKVIDDPNWVSCAFQAWLLLLHLHLMNAPLLAKFVAVLKRIREADTH